MLTDITESDIPGLPDDELNRVVARWTGEVDVCTYCAGSGVESQHTQATCRTCDGAGVCWPDYCNDGASAWRLLERMPFGHAISSDGRWLEYQPGLGPDWSEQSSPGDKDPKRALAETAAIFVFRGVEPREAEHYRERFSMQQIARTEGVQLVEVADDLEFIAHARQDLPALLDEADRLREERRELAKALRAVVSDSHLSDWVLEIADEQ